MFKLKISNNVTDWVFYDENVLYNTDSVLLKNVSFTGEEVYI